MCRLSLLAQFPKARHLFVIAFPSSSMRIHWMPSAALSVRVAREVLVAHRLRSSSSLTLCGMLVAHSSACQPSSNRSSISSLCLSSRFAKGGGLSVITMCHRSWACALFPKILVFFVSNLSGEGNSVAASSSSRKMLLSISLIW